jgi:hypothetical protein
VQSKHLNICPKGMIIQVRGRGKDVVLNKVLILVPRHKLNLGNPEALATTILGGPGELARALLAVDLGDRQESGGLEAVLRDEVDHVAGLGSRSGDNLPLPAVTSELEAVGGVGGGSEVLGGALLGGKDGSGDSDLAGGRGLEGPGSALELSAELVPAAEVDHSVGAVRGRGPGEVLASTGSVVRPDAVDTGVGALEGGEGRRGDHGLGGHSGGGDHGLGGHSGAGHDGRGSSGGKGTVDNSGQDGAGVSVIGDAVAGRTGASVVESRDGVASSGVHNSSNSAGCGGLEQREGGAGHIHLAVDGNIIVGSRVHNEGSNAAGDSGEHSRHGDSRGKRGGKHGLASGGSKGSVVNTNSNARGTGLGGGIVVNSGTRDTVGQREGRAELALVGAAGAEEHSVIAAGAGAGGAGVANSGLGGNKELLDGVVGLVEVELRVAKGAPLSGEDDLSTVHITIEGNIAKVRAHQGGNE